MSAPQGMEIYATRLESFETAHLTGKKNSKAGKWPHKWPLPEQLARAGFYYSPTASSPDNVTCAGCLKSMDEWQPEDDPIKEHLAYSSECGIAIHANLEQELEAGHREIEDPTSEKMINARKATFADSWPHERKRGWTCKTQKMVEAGWYYCPTVESDDFVKCAYCSLSLDGWEPKDKPHEEHQKRSADCLFFMFDKKPKAKATKAKKGRASKASRLSTQSTVTTATIASEDGPSQDMELDYEGDSVMTTNTDVTVASAATSKEKKGGRGKKTTAKAKAAKIEDVPIPELENEDLKIKIAKESKPVLRGRKRTSDAMSINGADEMAPPTKRRGTRTRSSTVKPEPVPFQENENISMAEADDSHLATTSKKSTKGKKRATSTTRKASNMSTASKASLRAHIAIDNEIEAELEADLERPLSDEEVEPTKAATRTSKAKQAQKKAASTASVRSRAQKARAAQESANTTGAADDHMNVDDSAEVGASIAPISQPIQDTSKETDEDHTIEDFVAPIINPKGRQPKKSRKKEAVEAELVDIPQATKNKDSGSQDADVSVEYAEKPTRAKGRQASRQVSRQTGRKTAPRSAEIETVGDSSALTLDTMTTANDSGHDSDASQATVRRGRATSRTAATGAKRGRKPKNAHVALETVGNLVPASQPVSVAVEDELQERTESQKVPIMNPMKSKGARGRPKGKKTSITSQLEELVDLEEAAQEVKTTTAPELHAITGTVAPVAADFHIKESEGANEADELPSEVPVATPNKSSPAQQIPSPTPSLQSSDAENQPPSSRPSATRPPLTQVSSSKANVQRVQIEASTPPLKQSGSKLETTFQWTAVEIEQILAGPSIGSKVDKLNPLKNPLSEAEKRMTVEEWIMHQALMGEERLKEECERIVGLFENEGVKALKALEGIVTE